MLALWLQKNILKAASLIVLTGFICGLVGVNGVLAAANPQMNYQGKLATPTGVAVTDGTYNMRFWLITSSTAATSTAVWTESLTGTSRVQVTNGLFSIMLGSTTPLTSVNFNQALYLGVEVGGTSTPAWDGEMSPRKILGTVPAAFVAQYAATAGAASSSDNASLLGGIASTSFLRSDDADIMTATSSATLISFIQNGAGKIASFFSGITEVFTILNNGNVGVGTTTPGTKFAVSGDARITGTTTLGTTTANNLTLTQALAITSGGTGATTAAAARTNLGATTLGSNLFTVTNPSAVTLLRVNADNTVSTVATSTLGIAISDTTGTLAATRGGTGLSTITQNQILLGGAGNTWSQVATSALGLSASFTNSSQLAGLLSDETGTGVAVFNTNPAFAGTATFSGLTATSTITFSGLTASRALFLDASSRATTTALSQTLIDSITNETGTGSLVFSAAPTFTGTANFANTANTGTLAVTGTTTLGTTTANNLTLTQALAITSGGTGATTAAAARTNLGATTLGSNLFTVTNPSAVTLLRVNADNTVSTVATSTLGIAISDTTGTLAATRGGTGLSTITQNQILLGGAGNTWSQVATSALGLSASFTNSSQLAGLLSDETGTGVAVFNTNPAFAGTATFSGLTATSTITFSGLTASRALFLDASSRATTTALSQTLIDSITNETGTGSLVFSAAPTFTGTANFANTANTGTLAVTGTTTLGTTTANNLTLTQALAITSGGTGATTAAAARTNLGATTLGSNLFTVTNPSAVTLLRVNADNTVSTVATSTLGIAISDTTGTLAATRGGTGLSTITQNQILLGGAGNTWSQVATSALGLSASFTNSSQLAGLLSDETGTGVAVFNTNPAFAGTATFSGLTATSTITFSGLTASRALFLDASSRATTTALSQTLIDSITNETGTGSLVFSAAPTFTGTANFANTANTGTLAVTGTTTLGTTTANNLTLTQALAITSGGTGATTAAAARTNLGATTLGSNLFTVTNPSAVTLLRVNADNTVSTVATSTLGIAISDTTGTLAATRGGTGLSTITQNQILLGGAGNTWSQVATSALGLSASFTNSSQLAGLLSDETGTGVAVFNTNPAFAGTATFSGLTATSTITFSGLTASRALFLDASSRATTTALSQTLIDSITNETGTGSLVFSAAPTFTGTANFANTANTGTLAVTGTTTLGTTTANNLTLTQALAITSGGTGATTAAAARTNLGATTLGSNLFTVTNPSAVTLLRVNADNTVSTVATSTLGIAISDTTGTLAATRGGTGLSTITQNQILLGGAGNTWSQVATSALGLSASFTNSSQLAGLLSDETGTGVAVFNTNPAFAGTATFSGLTATSTITFSGLTASRALFLDASSRATTTALSQTLIDSITNETGTGSLVFSAAPTFTGTANFANTANTGTLAVTGTTTLGTTTANNLTLTQALAITSGGTGATTAAAARTNLGATTLGSNLFTVTNPSAVTLLRVNADNTVSTVATSTLGIAISDTTGTLAATRGGTGLSTITQNQILLGGAGNTWSQVATSALGLSASFTNSSQLAGLLSDETGTGVAVFNTNPAFAGTATFSGLTATSTITFSGLTASRALFLDASSRATTTALSQTLIDSITNETGTGSLVFSAAPTFTGTSTFANITTSGQLAVTGTTTLGTTTISNALGIGTAAQGKALTVLQAVGGTVADFKTSAGDSYITVSTAANTAYIYQRSGSGLAGFSATNGFAVDILGSSDSVGVFKNSGDVAFGGTITDKTTYAGAKMVISGGTGNIAVGTTSPYAKLSVQNSFGSTTALFDIATTTTVGNATSSLFRINADGRVGIATSSPDSLFSVAGNTTLAGNLRLTGSFSDTTNSAGTNGMILQTTGTSTRWVATSSLGISGGASTFLALTDTPVSYTANRLMFTNSGATALTDSAGLVFTGTNFGIGSDSPLAKLQVVTDSDTTNGNPAVFDSKFSVVGSANNGGGVFNSYNQSSNVGFIGAISPGTAWRNLVIQPSFTANVSFGTTTAFGSDVNVAGNMAIGSTFAGLSAPTNSLIIEEAALIGTSSLPTQTKLYVRESGTSTGIWRGRIVNGGDTAAFLMGEYNGQAWLGSHNAALNAWADFYISPDGATQKTNIGSVGGVGGGPALTVQNSNGFVGVGTTTPGSRFTVAGDFRLTGALRDVSNSAGTVGQIMQSTASGVQWSATSTLGIAISDTTGTLAATRGGTGLSTITQNQILLGGAGNTWSQVATSALGLGNGTFLGLSDTQNSFTANRLMFTNSGATSLTDSASLVFDGTNFGIGSTTPSARLTVQGAAGTANVFTFASSTNASLLALTSGGRLVFGTSSSADIYMNGGATSTNPQNNGNNVAIGNQAFSYYSAGAALRNIALGIQALFGSSTDLMTGDDNFAAGNSALRVNTTGSYNNAMGNQALAANTTGSYNNAFGYLSLLGNLAGSHNNAFGSQALYFSTSSSYNNAFGYQTLYQNTTGSNNNAFGYQALNQNTTGSNNMAFGFWSLFFNTTGDNNVAQGGSALYVNNTGSGNTALNSASLYNNTSGSYNSAIGGSALYNNTTGSYNNALGNQAGYGMTTGTSTTFLGTLTGTALGSVSSSTAIGAGALLTQSNTMVLGGTGLNAVNIVSGTSTPWAKLSLQNNFGSATALFDIATTTSAAFATSSIFRVNADGRVGIATSSPDSLFSVAGNTTLAGNLRLTGSLSDSTNSAGTNGMILQTTGTGVQWVATSSLGLGGSSFTNSSQLAGLLSDETGTGVAVFNTNPAFAGTATFSGLTATSTITFSGLTASRALFLDASSRATTTALSQTLIDSITNETGTGSLVFSAAPTFTGTANFANTANTGTLAVTGTTTLGTTTANNLTLTQALAITSGGTGATTAAAARTNLGATTLGSNLFTVTNPSAVTLLRVNADNTVSTVATSTLGIAISDTTGTLAATRGGTGLSTITQNQILLGGAGNTWSQVATSALGLSASFTNSSQLAGLLSDETGTGVAVFNTNPAFAGTATFSGLTATSTITFSGLTASRALFLDASSRATTTALSQTLIDSITNETGTGSLVFSAAPTFTGTANFANTANTGTLAVTGTTTLGTTTANNLRLTAALFDTTNNAGTSGMVLQATGTSTRWVATSSLGISGGGASTFLALTDTPSSYTVNRLMFTNSGATALTDSASLVFTGTNFGIGSTTPSATLTVVGTNGTNPFTVASSTGASLLSVLQNGRVGIGTAAPSASFEVVASSTIVANLKSLTGDVYQTLTSLSGSIAYIYQRNSTGLAGFTATNGFSVDIFGGSDSIGVFKNSGDVALGGTITDRTTYAGAKLVINGATGNSVFGTSTPWAKLSVQNSFGSSTVLFDIATTTSASSATSSLFRVNANGRIGIGTTSASVASVFLQSQAGINAFAVASSSGTSMLTLTQAGRLGLGTTSPESMLAIDQRSITGAAVGGIDQYLTFTNSTASAVQYGDRSYLRTTNTATTTLVGGIIRIEDSTAFGNTVRGFEVQTERGSSTLGENTALSGFARTFGVRGVTEGDAGAVYEPAGVYGETQGTTQGNALRGYSSTVTTAALLKLFQDTSAFTGTGLLMNFGNSGGSFSSTTASRFIDLQNAGTSRFTVGSYGALTIGDGTTGQNAGIQIGNGGLCVDNDGTCTASTTGRISSVSTATGNSDLAEMYFSDENLEAGEVVYLKGGLSVGRADAADESADLVLGVVSTLPGLLLGYNDVSLEAGEEAHPIALAGRVPVQLSTENGAIKAGDALMLSSLPGIVMKASSTGTIVGTALEDFDSTRAYSETFVNQFGESIIEPNFTPINRVNDSRINDGCYFGGGVAAGDAPCVPLRATTTDAQYEEADALAAAEAKAEALAELEATRSNKVTLADGRKVAVGQIVMFVRLQHRYLDEQGEAMLASFLATSTTENTDGETETVWGRLVELANNFVDGVLSVFTLKADRVETSELCVDGVCLNADDLRQLLEQSAATTPETEEVVDGAESNDDTVDETVGTSTDNDGSTETPPSDPGEVIDPPVETVPPTTDPETAPETAESEPIPAETPPETAPNIEPEPSPVPEPVIE